MRPDLVRMQKAGVVADWNQIHIFLGVRMGQPGSFEDTAFRMRIDFARKVLDVPRLVRTEIATRTLVK